MVTPRPPPIVPEFAKVRRWTSCDVNGQILVWFNCDGLEPTWNVPEQQEITRGDWVYRGRTEHFINAHIEVGGGLCVCRSYVFVCVKLNIEL